MWKFWIDVPKIPKYRAENSDKIRKQTNTTHTHTHKKQLTKPLQLLIKPLIRGDRWQDGWCARVFTTAAAVILAWRRPSQVLPPGSHRRRHSGHRSFLCVCLSRRVSVWGQSNTLSCVWVCVFLRSSFGASVRVYMSCHAFVKGVFAENPTLWLKAVGMERDTENFP